MSALSIKIDNLRLMARLVREYDYDEISAMLRDAADTIESMRNRLQDAALGARECEMELTDTSYHGFDVYQCSECGEEVAELTYMGKSEKPNFCKKCGKAVKR